MNPFPEIKTPYYIVYEDRIRKNLETISKVSEEAGVKIIMALKANALWKTFPIVREYVSSSTASSLNEMRLSLKHLGDDVHAYCPAYTDETIDEHIKGCTHITFNSISQFERFRERIEKWNNGNRKVSMGLRVNPQCSVIETEIYNPCTPGSRFGAEIPGMPEKLPPGIEGFHFHALCESTSYDLENVLKAFESQFGKYLPDLKWVNMGGGHLMTKEGYDTAHLVSVLQGFRKRYPNLEVILEPGSAFMWRTGDLISSVVDIVEKGDVRTAIMDVSFACHMPDCLEMPYRPAVRGAETLGGEEARGHETEADVYRLGGNSCLSGDFMGYWRFGRKLAAGDTVVFEDMIHYTTVKTNMFNGIHHPSLVLQRLDGTYETLRDFSYDDYRNRMD